MDKFSNWTLFQLEEVFLKMNCTCTFLYNTKWCRLGRSVQNSMQWSFFSHPNQLECRLYVAKMWRIFLSTMNPKTYG